MTRVFLPICLLSALSCVVGCRQTRCEDLIAEPIIGSYHGGGSLGKERLLNVSFEASAKEVVLTYTTRDGSRIRASYRVLKKSKQH